MDVSEILDVRMRQDLRELLAQSGLHLVLGGIDAVFRQPSRLDIAIEDHNAVAGLGQLARGKQSCGAGAQHEDRLHLTSTPVPPTMPTRLMIKQSKRIGPFLCLFLFLMSLAVHAQTNYEIQVYPYETV